MNAYVRDGYREPNDGARSVADRSRQLGELDMDLRHVRAAHGDTDNVPTGAARFGFDGRTVCDGVMIPINNCRMTVIVHGRPVVVLGMIVVGVDVDVQRRAHRRRYEQAAREHGYDESAHGNSLLPFHRFHGTLRFQPMLLSHEW